MPEDVLDRFASEETLECVPIALLFDHPAGQFVRLGFGINGAKAGENMLCRILHIECKVTAFLGHYQIFHPIFWQKIAFFLLFACIYQKKALPLQSELKINIT